MPVTDPTILALSLAGGGFLAGLALSMAVKRSTIRDLDERYMTIIEHSTRQAALAQRMEEIAAHKANNAAAQYQARLEALEDAVDDLAKKQIPQIFDLLRGISSDLAVVKDRALR